MSSPDDERKIKHTELVLLDDIEAVKTVGLSWDNFRFTSTDPIFSSAKEFFKNAFKKRRYSSKRYRWSSHSFRNNPYGNDFDVSMTINGLPISVQKEKARININGHHVSLDTMCGALAKVLVVSFHEDNVMKLFSTLNSFLNIPENIHYVLENKVPYYFYQGGRFGDKVEVRLNVKQIGAEDFALEISDGVWGEISTDDLNTFCNTYRHNKKRGNWTNLSPRDLFYRLIERNPTDSEHELMVEFLKQNRQGDIVEKRAMKLLEETLEKFKDKLYAVKDEKGIESILVRGQLYDWKIERGASTSDLQKVRVSVWQPYLVNCYTREGEKILDENGKHLQVHQQPHWRGPICIDNLATGSSLGDQYVSRIMSTMNDKMLITLVKTIKNYLSGEPDTVRNKDLSSKLNRDGNNEM
tara:strand:- start:1326 stop:2558 length:1233 start_codon:yes stop_codon:yes gene_type:complete